MTMTKPLLLFLLANAHAFQTQFSHFTTQDVPPAKKRINNQRVPTGARGSGVAPPPSSLGMSTRASKPYERRRFFIQHVAQSLIFTSVGTFDRGATAETDSGLPKITHTVFMDVRISRADGSFYVRDATPFDSRDDEPVYAQPTGPLSSCNYS